MSLEALAGLATHYIIYARVGDRGHFTGPLIKRG